MKQKEIFSIIKSGLVGAFALTGICILLVIASQRSPTLVSLFESIFKIAPSIRDLFIIIGCIGFILGLVLRKCFPTSQRGIRPLVIAFIILALPLGFVTWICHKVAMQVEHPPQELKLADCTNNVVSFHFDAPKGHDHQLQIRIPEIAALHGGNGISSYDVSGHMRILSGGTLLADMPIGSGRSWLNGDAYGLTIVGLQNTNVLSLSKLIQSHKNYEFEITLGSKPPTNASIWIEWWESRMDK